MKLFVVFAYILATVNCASLKFEEDRLHASGRIFNGYDAMQGEAPYIVSMKAKESAGHFCGGSIIAPHWVLTAAHCLIYESFDVIAGLHSLDDESNAQIRKVAGKQSQIVHDEYVFGDPGPNDIGLIYVAEAFDLNALTRNDFSLVTKIALPSGVFEETGRGKLFGWGRNSAGILPNVLQTLNVNIIGYDDCKASMRPSSAALLDPRNLCTHTADTPDGTCSGDSGGPLIRYTTDGPELVGIVSWGYGGCVILDSPDVYTMASYFIPWINKTMNSYRV